MKRCLFILLKRFSAILFLFIFVSNDQSVAQCADSTKLIVRGINIIGNASTKNRIITKELLFKDGDTISKKTLTDVLTKSRNSIFNTGLFNTVNVNFIYNDSCSINVLIYVSERWYLWPIPILEFADRNINAWWLKKEFSHLNIGAYLIKFNFRGRSELLAIHFKTGFTKELGVSYSIPYIDRKQRNGLGFSMLYSLNKQVVTKTEDNRLIFFKDLTNFNKENLSFSFSHTYRKEIYNTHTTSLRYHSYTIDDTIFKQNPVYLGLNNHSLTYLTIDYKFSNDKRDYQSYPLKGHLFEIDIIRHGFGLLKKENIGMTYLHATLRKYVSLGKGCYAAASTDLKLSDNGYQPYAVQRGLGYSHTIIRGYEYYVVDGQSYFLLKSGIKKVLISPRVKKIPFIKSESFNEFKYGLYLSLYGDAGFVKDNQFNLKNQLANGWQYGYGIGLDWLLAYDVIFRTEYSINKFKESGLFLHFLAPI